MEELRKRAVHARTELEDVIVLLLSKKAGGMYNNEIAQSLGLESDHEGKQFNYLTYSLLGALLASGRVRKEKREGRVYYSAE